MGASPAWPSVAMGKKRKTSPLENLLEDEAVSEVIESSREESCDADGDLCASCYGPRREHDGPDGENKKTRCRKFR